MAWRMDSMSPQGIRCDNGIFVLAVVQSAISTAARGSTRVTAHCLSVCISPSSCFSLGKTASRRPEQGSKTAGRLRMASSLVSRLKWATSSWKISGKKSASGSTIML